MTTIMRIRGRRQGDILQRLLLLVGGTFHIHTIQTTAIRFHSSFLSASLAFCSRASPFNNIISINNSKKMRTITSGANTVSVSALNNNNNNNKKMSETAPFLAIPPTMKCIVYSGESPRPNNNNNNNNKLMVMEQIRPTPRPKQPGHVLIKVMAVGLNPVDAKQVIGDKVPQFMQWIVRKTILKNKCIPGFDFSGIVVEDHDDGFSQGDTVYGCMPPWHGTCAEYISAPIHQVAYMPRNYTFEQAAALPLVGLTALQCLQPFIPSRTSLETSILIIGASGGTGSVALQFARILGAKHRTAICSMSNTDFVKRQCGATTVIDYNTNNMTTIMEQLCAAPGCPYSIVLDCVTSADTKIDSAHIDYRKLVHQMQKHNMLTNDYIHRRLGGSTFDWIRAGWERSMTGSTADSAITSSSTSWSSSLSNCCWSNAGKHEKLFWIRLPHSSQQLSKLTQMVEQGQGGSSSSNDIPLSYKQRNSSLRVKIQDIYPSMTAQNVNRAFQQLLSRRVQGKIVITVHDNDNNNNKNNDNEGIGGGELK